MAMGYTHYWKIKRKDSIPAEAQVVLRELLGRAYQDGRIQREFDDPNPPLISDREIRFNGVGYAGHETFAFDLDDAYCASDGGHFAFCKTNQKPYDEYVMKSLLVLKHFMGDGFSLSSDGGFDDEWHEARRWCEEHLGIISFIRQELTVG